MIPQGNHLFFFQKNPDNLFQPGRDFTYPSRSAEVHFEVEMVVFLKGGGSNISIGNARDCVFGYGVGIDFTRRDLQAIAKKLSRPWEAAKAFEGSAPVSEIVTAEAIGHPAEGQIWLNQNGNRKQSGNLNQMIWKVPEIISELSWLFQLAAGDVIFTGTPAGVGEVSRGDTIECGIDGIASASLMVK